MCSIKDIQPVTLNKVKGLPLYNVKTSLLGDIYKLEASQFLLKHYKKHYFLAEAGGGVVWIIAKQLRA
jgi:hypothetical protein